jgi:hypothetical protein
MKNARAAAAAGLLILLSACTSTFKLVVDDTNPVEQNAVVTVGKGGFIILKEWNGIAIKDNLYTKKRISQKDTVLLTIPAGDNSITFDVYFTFSNQYSSTTYHLEDIQMNYKFEGGRKYQIRGATKFIGLLKGYELLVRLYDVTPRSKPELLKEWTVGKT